MNLEKILDENVYLYSNVISTGSEIIYITEKLDIDPRSHEAAQAWKFWYPSDETGLVYGSTKTLNLEAISKSHADVQGDLEFLSSEITNGVSKVAEQFFIDKKFGIAPNTSTFARISKYMPGCVMGAHFDTQTGDTTMEWSIIIYPNDDYEGGEISFLIRDVDLKNPNNGRFRPADNADDPRNAELVDFTVKPKAGQALIFPSTHPYMHQVHTLKSGTKYIIPGYIYKSTISAD